MLLDFIIVLVRSLLTIFSFFRIVLERFFREKDVRCIIILDTLKLSEEMPNRLPKSKCLALMKTVDTVSDKNIYETVISTELGGRSPFEHLELVSKSVLLPILKNPINQQRWGEVTYREINESFHSFLSSTTILCGQVKGQTILPMPYVENLADLKSGSNSIALLEATILTWTKQIKNILKQDSGSQFREGLHPTPDVEISFWKTKAGNLNAIFEQLQGPQVAHILRTLDQVKSTYCESFASLCKEVYQARLEANDNVKFLGILEEWVEKLVAVDDLSAMQGLFRPFLHTVLLIWKHSKYYNTPSRIVVLLKEVCNSIIEQSTRQLSGEQIFAMIENEEASEAISSMSTIIHICDNFKNAYSDYKDKAKIECPDNPWNIQNIAIFHRLDTFVERCADIINLIKTNIQFSKLCKVEIGSTKGKILSDTVHKIHHDFHKEVEKIMRADYDIMNVEILRFDDDYHHFRRSVKEMERRIGSAISSGLDDCLNIYSKFQLLDLFDSKLLERTTIKEDLESKHIDLIQSYSEDLKLVQNIFVRYRDCPPSETGRNLPPTTSSIVWCRGLIQRIVVPMCKLRDLDENILKREEAKQVIKMQQALVKLLEGYEMKRIQNWEKEIAFTITDNLCLNLIGRNPQTRELFTNFNPSLVCLLREVKYFITLGINVPSSALEIYKSADQFRRWTGNLDLIVSMNNSILQQIRPVEKPLVDPYLVKFDSEIERGISEMHWRSEGIDDFIKNCLTKIENVHDILKTMQQNFSTIVDILASWDVPMLERKSKPIEKDEFGRTCKTMTATRFAELKDAGKTIHTLLKETNKFLNLSASSHDWKCYMHFVSGTIIDGLVKAVTTSLKFLYEQIEYDVIQANGTLPLLEIQLDVKLDSKQLVFLPSLNHKIDSLQSTIDSIIGSFMQQAGLLKRVDGEGTYLRDMHSDISINSFISSIYIAMSKTEVRCQDLERTFNEHSFLWTTDLHEYFKNFCDGATITTEKGTFLLDLSKFETEIQRLKSIQATVGKYNSPVDIGWLRIDTNPAKKQVSLHAMKWINTFTDYILESVVATAYKIYEFMEKVKTGLVIEVKENGKNNANLFSVMAIIRDVRKYMEFFSEVYEPQNECMQLLRAHGVDTIRHSVAGKNIQEFLEEMPLLWEATVKKTMKKKEEILPMQMDSIDALKSDLDDFVLLIRSFRGEFRQNAPFKYNGSVAKAYDILNTYAGQLETLEMKVHEFREFEDLFELQQSNYLELSETRQEIKQLKDLWDFKSMVMHIYSNWRTSLWKDVNTEDLEHQNRKLRKHLKDRGNSSPVIKGWQIFRDIDALIATMNVALPLVHDLHSDAMRKRHWSCLARICNVKIIDPNDAKFTLDDMMSLNLHLHKDAIEEVIETATKELKIEKKLAEIEEIWSRMQIDYVAHKDTEMFIPRPTEELVESIESHQMELQGIFGMGKFMDFFKEKVIHWQTLLRVVDDTLRMWLAVVKSWTGLESIFLSSADIRSQLPEDTQRFEGIDSNFKELMKDAILNSNCVSVCSIPGRFEALSDMRARLELCQKSLNEYLDVKKKIFPRFYFVSSVALLDMLANGTNPPKIMPYLGDCYDALADLSFIRDCDGQLSNKCVDEMIAKDGERVALVRQFSMDGEVENYLNGLTSVMQDSLKYILSDAIEKAASWEIDAPRHEWLFNYPAQLCITGTQIYWTDETQLALEEYESGQEDAVKRYLQLCNSRLSSLIQLVLGDLTSEDRTKIISLITMDVHSRDVVDRLVQEKTEGPASFTWQQQLRFEWHPPTCDVNIKICDFQCKYFYEWVGNTGRLVITPLTDRCYITLTMGLKLFLGGAPAGPAGTGKTETTKDLARALAIPCYVFNCSDQMNFQSMADIFRGLAQTGAWGCFDEFNRIPIEVLSVVATQVKTIQDAIVKFSSPENRTESYKHLPAGTPPVKVGEFDFMGDTISLIPTCGFWITMNPGYAGRTELPENLKALFRSCAMIRPDMRMIQENMLMAEGFQTARALSIKFNTLYELSAALLSKQPHYDWGLRAVKSVLRVAGSMKRANPNLDEAQVLMRALRDFNTPKIPSHDIPIFLRLINDLFMGLNVSSKVDDDLKSKIITVSKLSNLQHDEIFINKVCNFKELLDVRHSVMLLGPAGCAKTTVWRTLQAVHNLDKKKPICVVETVNPKSVTGDELYGYMTLAKDWKDGVLSIIMRGMSKNFSDQGFYDYQTHKWVVLDGDIDAVWIESMNTVMDDNKVLTLVSNERVPLSSAMRMVFEINSLKNATPATVSRAGILYINETDIGWRPFVETWVHNRGSASEKNFLPGLFDRYVDTLVEMTRKGYKEVTRLRVINKVCTIAYLLEGILPLIPEDKMTADVLEMAFCFCAMWAFGGPMVVDKSGDYRKKFSEDFSSIFNTKFPKDGGLCFDYFFDPESLEYVHWNTKVSPYKSVPIGNAQGQSPFNSLFVETVETTRMSYLLDNLVRNGRYSMFVGNAGTGKTEIINHYLDSLDKENDKIISKNIVLNYYTSSKTLQQEMEGYIDKRSGSIFGPPMGKKMVFFVDDLNLPEVETYGTQNAIALLTQHMQYGSIFDRNDLGMRKHIMDVQYIAAMNSTAGSFDVCERLQRHFATFSIAMPSANDLSTIFSSMMGGHVQTFQPIIHDLVGKIVDSAIAIHDAVCTKFLPSAVKFMYNWNMRDLTNIFQGCCLALPEYYIKPITLARLYVHETQRVYSDRFVSKEEIEIFDSMCKDILKKNLPTLTENELFDGPLVFTTFASSTDGAYLPIQSMDSLKTILENKLNEYNESNAMMDLVLFEQAILHITRINRVIQNPGGHAMLIGVGGSGKQSLCRLAAFISDFEVKQLTVTSNFKIDDFKDELRSMYVASGVKGVKLVFLMTDSQIVKEEMLIYINGILTSGWIPDLFSKEDLDNILGSISNDARAEGIPDILEARTKYFISRVKKHLHVVLAFSPVGDSFRVRARRFPGLVNCTGINQFHPWPRDALVSVAERFIEDIEIPGPSDIKSQLAQHMAEEHLSVAKMSKFYFETQRRYNYVTPKSFLELISFFKHLLNSKRTKVHGLIDRLDVGLSTLQKTSNDVMELQKDLDITMKKVEEKKVATDNLINEMKMQQADAQVQDDKSKIEAQRANEESSNALVIEKEAEKELSEAEPAMKAAADAVNCLSKAMLTELKALSKPPSGVDMVTNSCLILIEKEYNPKKQNWNRAKAMMQNVDAFKNKLAEFRGEDITDQEIALLSDYIQNPNFSPEKMISKSAAAANLCTWVVNIYAYNRIYIKVKPLMDSLNDARQKKESALARLADAEKKVADVQAHLKTLEEKYNGAMREKQEVEEQALALQNRANLAKRLVGGLASENVRWAQEIEKLKAGAQNLPGDCMLAAGFISYLGAFDQALREELWRVQWSSDLVARGIPMTANSDPIDLLTDNENNSKMISEGLPSDRISIENGSIATTCKRWPLIIDPQAQGIKWLKQKEEGNVDVVQLTQKNWTMVVQNAISNGRCVIIENLGSEIDATLDPVLSRAIYKKGRTLYLKFAGEEIEYDPAFQLYLQTKLSNPHYKPEIAAQCTIINFIATQRGLEDQLLAKVVEKERKDLEENAKSLMAAAMKYQMQLVKLEDDLLERLANAPDDILSDVALIEGLEATKQTAKEISEAVESGKKTQAEVEAARELYRPQAAEGAMLYFILTKLNSIDHMYQYSLDSFNSFFEKSILRAEKKDSIEARVASLQDSLRVTIFTWVSRGLFERHKLMFLAQITFNLMKRGVIGADQWSEEHFQFLLKAPTKNIQPNPLDWLPDNAWMSITALGEFDDFSKLPSDLIEASPRFREWFNATSPENEKLPLDWAALDRFPFLKLLVIRSLRPDRMISALTSFIRKILPSGSSYVDCDSTLNSLEILDQCLMDSTPSTPIYFILSPGANVVADLDVLAAKYGFQKGVSYHNVSMGQGQDLVAMSWLETAHRNGHWVILNNVHLMPRWLVELEKKLDEYAVEGSHSKFRVFLTSDPSTTIPIGLLSRCIKITNEPPTGLKANLKRAWCFFSKDYIDDTDSKTRSILFGLCHFHSIMMERKTFGPLGFNMKYPFSIGDLRDSAICLQNYMENSGGGKIPWQDLKYIFGEIMYGGHIVNDFDRLVANEYLNFFMKDELLDEMEMFPFVEEEKGFSFLSPPPTSFEKYIEHIDTKLIQDTPIAFGLHPNAEIEFRTTQSNDTFRMLQDLQPKDAGSGDSGLSPLHVAEAIATDILDKLGEKVFDVDELIRNLDDQGPYQNVFIQEMDIMNVLLSEIKRSIKELQLGFAGELTMSASMEDLLNCFYLDRVPSSWAKLAWASKRGLQSWIRNMLDRIAQLEEWSNNPGELPKVTKINLLVNPNSFLTAICQVTAQKKNWELDKLVTFTEVTKKTHSDEIDSSSRDGVYVTGLFLQGARWDTTNQQLEKSLPKEMYCPMPIINIRAVTREKANVGGIYHCPVYVTEERGPTYVFTTQLKTKSNPSRWVMAGVALLLDLSIN